MHSAATSDKRGGHGGFGRLYSAYFTIYECGASMKRVLWRFTSKSHRTALSQRSLVGTAAVVALFSISACSTITDDNSLPGSDLEISQVDRVAEYESIQMARQRDIECLRDAGIQVDEHSDGSMTIHDMPGDNAEGQFTRTSRADCSAAADYPEVAPLSRNEVNTIYSKLLESRKCLIGEGATISEPPTRETFLESYIAMESGSEAAAWNPYLELTPALFQEFERSCPQPDIIDH